MPRNARSRERGAWFGSAPASPDPRALLGGAPLRIARLDAPRLEKLGQVHQRADGAEVARRVRAVDELPLQRLGPVERAAPKLRPREEEALLARAAKRRAVASTAMNEQSSRSHQVFTLYIKGAHAGKGIAVTGSLNLCDLAGSERLSRSGAEGDRKKEAAAINKSLSCLADVFTALAKKTSHVPFRNSKCVLQWRSPGGSCCCCC